MANDASSNNLALLIDGDNVTYRIIPGLMAEIQKYGRVSVRRIYGDWTNPTLKNWKQFMLDHSIIPMQQFAYTNHKNATDGAMIIDAMDLLYTNRFTGFCIVSSDSDFTRLAARIREQGLIVYGFGERKTNSAFIAACDKFIYFDVLSEPTAEASEQLTAPQSTDVAVGSPPESSRRAIIRAERPRRPIDNVALTAFAAAVRGSPTYDDDYANLADVGHYLNRVSPDLNARNYGYERLKEFAQATGIVELKWRPMGDKPPIALVRLLVGPGSN